MIPLFDLHCDTLLELYKKNEDISKNSLHISLDKAKKFSPYMQVFAIWSDSSLSNEESYQQYINVKSYALNQMTFSESKNDFKQSTYILAIEDARLLKGDITRLDTLYND